MKSEIKGILFDKDGTLFDLAATWVVWCERVFEELAGGDTALMDAMAEQTGFDRATRSFQIGARAISASSEEVNQTLATVLGHPNTEQVHAVALRHLGGLPCHPVCDLPRLLNGLRERGLTLGVATNDYEIGAKNQLGDAGITDLFDFVCGFDSGFGAKPGPGMIDGFCTSVGLRPDQVAMVGDSAHDMDAGRAAGVGCRVGVLTGSATRAYLSPMADLVLDDISELLDHL